jgi:predicted DNA binding protein
VYAGDVSVLLECTIEADAFQLGQVLAPPAGMVLELERIVPTDATLMPFVWAIGEEYHAFEERVRAHPAVESLTALDRFGNRGLYRLEWRDSPTDFIAALGRSEAVVLEARGDESWAFRLRFPDHESLSAFHSTVRDLDIPLRIDRTRTLSELDDHGQTFDLTPAQREALVLALERGYFASPSEVQLDELADELGITRQALSKRIRRGNEKILESTLLSYE